MFEQDQKWNHKWGFQDTQFKITEHKSVILTGDHYELCGVELPYFLPFIETEMEVNLNLNESKQEKETKLTFSPNIHNNFYQELQKLFKKEQYTLNDQERLIHSHGQTCIEEVYQVLYQTINRTVDLVFYAETETDIIKVIELAVKYNICLIPFGGGTNVTCALKIPASETRMIVSVDMRKMNKIEWIDSQNLRACVQAGITGKKLEEELKKQGFLCGHEPDSYEFSTLGGWIATHASGMKKNRYGNIENIVEQITLISPLGKIEKNQVNPRSSQGIETEKLCFGSEGNLGIITKAIIKIYPLPSVKKYGSIVFPNWQKGVEFLEQLAQTNYIPASVRLVDNTQFRFGQALKSKVIGIKQYIDKLKKFYLFKIKNFSLGEMVATTLVMEGSKEEVAYQEKNIYQLAQKFQGIKGGETNGKRGYMLTYAIAYIRDFLLSFDLIGETFETSVSWSNINQVCQEVEMSLKRQYQEFNLPGKPFFSTRISQIYHTGVCLYFTLGISAKGVDNSEQIYQQIEHNLRQVILDNGGSISHHHGVGKLRSQFMNQTQSNPSIELLKNLKKFSDPQNIFGVRNNIFLDLD